MPNLALLLGAGLAGAYLAARLHLPGGSFIGAVLCSAAVSLALAEPETVPPVMRSAALILMGISVGATVERQALLRLRRALPVAMVLVLLFILAAAGIGRAMHALSGTAVSPATVVLGVMPGGASGLSAAAMDLGADVAIVASIHSLRLFIVLSMLPVALRWLVRAGQSPPAPLMKGGWGDRPS